MIDITFFKVGDDRGEEGKAGLEAQERSLGREERWSRPKHWERKEAAWESHDSCCLVVPPFTDTRCTEPPNRDHVVLGKLMFVKLEVDGKPETVPLELLRTALIIDKSTDRITYSPQPVEWEREGSKGVDVFAEEK